MLIESGSVAPVTAEASNGDDVLAPADPENDYRNKKAAAPRICGNTQRR